MKLEVKPKILRFIPIAAAAAVFTTGASAQVVGIG